MKQRQRSRSRLLPVQEIHWSCTSPGLEIQKKWPPIWPNRRGGELLEIEPAVPYPEDYSECGDVAKNERDEDERPAIENLPESLEQYDTILVGYPIWWHTAPMIIGTFLESYDLTGTDIYPFSQSASMDTEQFENSMDFVRESAGNANVHEGLFAEPSDTEAIDRYLTENGLIQ